VTEKGLNALADIRNVRSLHLELGSEGGVYGIGGGTIDTLRKFSYFPFPASLYLRFGSDIIEQGVTDYGECAALKPHFQEIYQIVERLTKAGATINIDTSGRLRSAICYSLGKDLQAYNANS